MTWVFWALLSALFAAATALLAKVGVAGVDSNLATAIRTTVILVFTWGIALALEKHHGLSEIGRRSWVFLVLSGICVGRAKDKPRRVVMLLRVIMEIVL